MEEDGALKYFQKNDFSDREQGAAHWVLRALEGEAWRGRPVRVRTPCIKDSWLSGANLEFLSFQMENGSSFHDHQSRGPGAGPVQLIYTPELNTIKDKRKQAFLVMWLVLNKHNCSIFASFVVSWQVSEVKWRPSAVWLQEQASLALSGFIRRKKTHLEIQTLQFRLNILVLLTVVVQL